MKLLPKANNFFFFMAKIFIDVFPPENKGAAKQEPAAENLTEEISEDGADLEIGANIPPLPVGRDLETRPRVQYNLRRFDAEDAQRDNGGKAEFLKGLFWKFAAIAAAVFLAMYAIDYKFAKAEIKIWPHVSEFRQEINAGIDTSIGEVDLENKLIPGYLITAENTITQETPATGQNSRQAKARGTIKIFNNYTVAQRLVKGTRLQAPLEKFQPALEGDQTPWFRTVEDLLIDPKSSAVAQVVADGVGEKYNIEPSVFSVPGLVGTAQYTFVYGQSFEKFSGGSDEAVPEVTKDDVANARETIDDFAAEKIKNELVAKIHEQGLEIADEREIKFEIGESEVLAKAGDAAAMINSQVIAKASAVAFKRSDFEDLGREFILAAVPQDNLIDEKSFFFDLSVSEDEERELPMRLACGISVYQGMEEHDLKKALSEKSGDEAKIFLASQPGIKQVEIKLAPPWRLDVPRSLDKIDVQTIIE